MVSGGLSELLSVAMALPAADVGSLVDALQQEPQALGRVASQAGSPALREACAILTQLLPDYGGGYLAGWVAGAAQAAAASRRSQQVDIVWTGPNSDVDTGRFTSQVVINLVGEAEKTLLLATYVSNPERRIADALVAAASRGVDVTVLSERPVDNPAYQSSHDALAGLPVRRLVWPAERRQPGASLHPKFVVVDERTALVGSANLTGRALDVNLECGVLIRGGPDPESISAHVWSLVRKGVLVSI